MEIYILSLSRLLKGRSIPGKISSSQMVDQPDNSNLYSPTYKRSLSYNDVGTSYHTSETGKEEVHSKSKPFGSSDENKQKISTSAVETSSELVRKSSFRGRATDSTRVMKFTKVLSGTMVILGISSFLFSFMSVIDCLPYFSYMATTNYGNVICKCKLRAQTNILVTWLHLPLDIFGEKLRELAWSGVPDYMRPTVWRLLLCYDIPDTERSDDEINMLHQIAVDCPRTVPDVPFFHQQQVQKSLERILYTWAIRHPASGYVQGINDLVTPFLVVFLSEHLEGSIDHCDHTDGNQTSPPFSAASVSIPAASSSSNRSSPLPIITQSLTNLHTLQFSTSSGIDQLDCD
ncbi:hypothetical protein TanjilG_05959 [Lupinus angustifolius]|uniref:Rab-GAP TBC domain-containing protein n=1 Tax=Lupinus angustifolius TaxID=3871 RepID=A0A4P1RE61_LUPAN|nr:hypothetical protein TanjilG_05959 [Lupinus angustifolius]